MDILDLKHMALSADASAAGSDYDLVTLNYLVLLDTIRQENPPPENRALAPSEA